MTHNELFWTTCGLLVAFAGVFILMIILAVKGSELQDKYNRIKDDYDRVLEELKKLKEGK